MRLHGFQGAQHFQLLVAHAVGIQRHRRVHGDQAQQLQHVVLHHVAHGTGFIVVAAASLQPDRFGYRDLHVVDHVGGPQTLEDRVGEAQCHQVLHCLLAQIVVDAEGPCLGEHFSDLIDDHLGRGEVVADRLFQHDAGLFGDQPAGGQRLADGPIQVRRGGEVENPYAVRVQQVAKAAPIGIGFGGVDRDVVQLRQEAVHDLRVLIGAGDVLFQRLGRSAAKILVRQFGAGGADDAGFGRHLAVAEAVIQRGKQFSKCQVAGRAEHDAVENGNGNDLRHPSALLVR